MLNGFWETVNLRTKEKSQYSRAKRVCDFQCNTLDEYKTQRRLSSRFSEVNSTTAKTVVHGIIKDIPIPFPVPEDGCGDHNLKCPVVAGATDVYSNYVFCSPEYPSVSITKQLFNFTSY